MAKLCLAIKIHCLQGELDYTRVRFTLATSNTVVATVKETFQAKFTPACMLVHNSDLICGLDVIKDCSSTMLYGFRV